MTNTESKYAVLLFYKFVNIPNAQEFTQEHLAYCKQLGIKGRILIADEGINGTLSGTIEQTDQYMADMRQNPLFTDMVYKIDYEDEHAFRKIFVRYRQELVTFRLPDMELDPNVIGGKRLSPVEFHEYLQRDDVIVLDGRNGYEFDLGHFRNAIRPDIEAFREFPEWIRENMSQFKDKPVLTYCTGGIRCEKLTGFLIEEGFQDVYQLDGGIVTYGKDEEVKGRLFDGQCYVFDERISVPINRTDEDITVGRCIHCDSPSNRFINCANDACHRQHICCEECDVIHSSHCSDECVEVTNTLLAQKQDRDQAMKKAAI
ncbi:oxygen-dependent tRNA uridine(34) hydroxylase TrhO [Paenibacillus spongiae]|uniref:tRNA uridine(34) hydroxylase n=1 Tax=Paenibacillus spongiae TaxID=2909671 RepID=A0ABY5SC59_9BACL|nr:rhodanese-related sulfurtransferase [Paenibacillus spongiae]UVI31551.1 rhodanese-related sulfurtransferase [Paenibacillus spongiae]